MRYTLSGFRKFLEEMDPTLEKEVGVDSIGSEQDDKEDVFGAYGDEFGMTWDQIRKAMQAEPWISSHFGLGSDDNALLYKLSPWEILSFTPQGAVIRLKPQNHSRSYLKGNRLNKSHYKDNKKYFIGRKELAGFLTKGWSPAVQAAAGAGG